MSTPTTEGARLQDALNSDHVRGWYSGMGDPLYALESAGAIVVYGSSDLGVSSRICAQEAKQEIQSDPDPEAHEGANALWELSEALEPMLEEVSNAAEDANLETDGDPYRRAGAVACEWMHRNGLGRWDYAVERGWSRGARVSITRVS